MVGVYTMKGENLEERGGSCPGQGHAGIVTKYIWVIHERELVVVKHMSGKRND